MRNKYYFKLYYVLISFGTLLIFNPSLLIAQTTKDPKLVKEIKVKGEIKNISDSDIVVTNDRLLFLDEAGNIKKEKVFPDPERTRIKLSKNGNIIGQTTAYGVSEKGPERINFEMSNREGALLWGTDYIGIGPFHLSEAKGGTVVQQICYEGACTNKVQLFDKENPKGKIITAAASSDAESTGGDVSEDGNYFAITFASLKAGFYLAFFDISGKQLWEYHLADAWGNEVGVSPFGNFVVATISKNETRENHNYIFNKQGQLIMKQPTGFVGDYHFKFGNDEKHLAVGSSNGELYLFETNPPKLKWQYFVGNENIGFVELDLLNGSVAGGATTKKPADMSDGTLPRYVYLFNDQGKLTFKKQFVAHGFTKWRQGPKIRFVRPDGKEISVTLKNKILKYAR